MKPRKGVLVAALAAIAPLVAALPATAATGGNGSVLPYQSSWPPHPHHRHGPPHGPGWIFATPRHAIETDEGNVSFVVTGTMLPRLQIFTLHSPGLDAACLHGNTLTGKAVGTDFNGRFYFPASAHHCVNGVYLIEASEHTTPFRTYITTLVIESPHNVNHHGPMHRPGPFHHGNFHQGDFNKDHVAQH